MNSHTNGGIPGPLSCSPKIKENFLSGAISVAYLSHPDFNGSIRWSTRDDGNMIAHGIDVYASGLRNPFGLVLHSNGNLYATGNGPNVDYGRMSTRCRSSQSIDDAKRDDKLLLVTKAHYYGRPNRKRAAYFNDARQCVWYPPETNSIKNMYTSPLLTHLSSIDGILEYHGNHFKGKLHSNLLFI
jgi:Glucose / Sorbosone dehydrogenase